MILGEIHYQDKSQTSSKDYPLYFELFPSNTRRLIPVNLGLKGGAIGKLYRSYPFTFSPTTFAISLFQEMANADTTPRGNRLNLRNFTNYLERHYE
jgi:hypothetical protein